MKTILTAVFVVLFAWGTTFADDIPVLVEPEWLEERLDEKLVILHVARDSETYSLTHIPGARFLDFTQLVELRDGIRNEMPSLETLTAVFQAVGIDEESRVIVYGEGNGILAARTLVSLEYLGKRGHVGLLNGQLGRWKNEKRPLSDNSVPVEKSDWEPVVQEDVLASMDDVRAARTDDSGETILVDSRSVEDYAEHIPGAIHIHWQTCLVDGTEENPVVLSPDEVSEMMGDSVSSSSTVITYCNSGMQASMGYVLARMAGLPVRLYDGSMSEWKAREGEIETVDKDDK